MAKKISPAQQAIVSASDAGLHATTIVLSRRLLVDEPDNVRVLIDFGHASWQLARYEEAESALRHAMDVCDEDKRDVIFGEMGNLCKARGDFSAAEDWFEKQIATDPDDATGYLFKGTLQMRRGELSAAATTLERGTECEYGCLAEVHLTLGMAYSAEGKFSEAAVEFNKSLAHDPQNLVAKVGLKDIKSAALAAS